MRWLRQMLDAGTSWWVNTVQPPNAIPNPDDPDSGPRTELIAAINQERTSRGLAALTENKIAEDGAQRWAEAMARLDRLTHGDFGSRLQAEFPNTYAAEDIAEGPDVKTVMQMWMDDPPHRRAILGDYDILGCGFAKAASGTIYWCIDFDKGGAVAARRRGEQAGRGGHRPHSGKNYTVIDWRE